MRHDVSQTLGGVDDTGTGRDLPTSGPHSNCSSVCLPMHLGITSFAGRNVTFKSKRARQVLPASLLQLLRVFLVCGCVGTDEITAS